MAQPATAINESLVPQIELFFSGRNLKNRDTFSFSDTFAVVYYVDKETGHPEELGRTEVLNNSLNPDWRAQFVLDYLFGEVQTLVVKVYDEDRPGDRDLNRQQLIGEATFVIDQLMGQRGQSLTLPLTGPGRNLGKLWVRAEQMEKSGLFLRLDLSGKHLANKDGLFGRSDPFITASRSREDGAWQVVWTSETINNNLNPAWKTATISIQRLCNGDLVRPIKFDIYDQDSNGASDFMGCFTTSVEEILRKVGQEYNVIEEAKRKKKKNYTNSGTCLVRHAEMYRVNTMLDYLKGGCELSMMVAIDFTASNGNPTTPQSLHFIDPTRRVLNEYERAIISVGSILEHYDTDKRFPVFGFGGRLPAGTSHCFRLSTTREAEVQGVQGVLDAYHGGIQSIALSGPTLMSLLIREATRLAREADISQVNQRYLVLLIIADGVINDMADTIDAIIAASFLPLSIIIVGVGAEDFSDMRLLDADDRRLVGSDGRPGMRDIVQFVEMRKYGPNQAARLAADVLREIPRQLVDFFTNSHITPAACVTPTPPAMDELPPVHT